MIVSFTGLIGSGKSTASSYLIEHRGFNGVSYASSLKDVVAAIFSWPRDLLEGSTAESRVWRESPDYWWSSRLGMTISPRFVLQNLGTDVLRTHFHPDIWVASVERQLLNQGGNVVITDCRFPNEVSSLRKLGGTIVQVKRGPDPSWHSLAVRLGLGPDYPGYSDTKRRLDDLGIHPSEYLGASIQPDVVIANDGSIGDLYAEIERVIFPD